VQSFQSVHVLRLLVTERETNLRRTLTEGRVRPARHVRRVVGRRLVHLGAWLAAEPATKPAWAR
jgi:hypothetical protein